MNNSATFHCEFEVKRAPDARTFSGLASTFGNEDLVGDVIELGAFALSISERGPDGIKLLWQHDHTEPIGTFAIVQERPDGLFVEGELLDTTRGLDVHKMLRAGAIDAMSIGFRTIKDRFDAENNVRILEEVDLLEVSLVTFPANPEARVTSVKAALDAGQLPDKVDLERALRDLGFSRQQAKAFIHRGYDGLEPVEAQLSSLALDMRRLAKEMVG